MKKIRCPCGGVFEEKKVKTEGFLVDGLKCNMCGEITFSLQQFKKVFRFRQLAKEIDSTKKIVQIGNSIGLILPKGIEKLGLKVGDKVKLKLENKKKMELILE